MTDWLRTLITKGTCVIILKLMPMPSVRGLATILQHEPTEELVLPGRLGLPELCDTQEL
jgi:hypothetical protein